MVDPLEVLCSVVLGETIQQIVSFIQNRKSQKHLEDKIHRLRQLLIEIHTALEAAKGCAITNLWLLRWLRELEDAACQGDQTLRNCRDRSNKVSSSSNTFKRIRLATVQLLPCKEVIFKIAVTIKKLEAVADGIPKFIQFLKMECTQEVVHRPVIIFVSIHDRLVGRVNEKKQVIEFLLKPPLHHFSRAHIEKIGRRNKNGSSPPDGCVLLIWGVKGVGKTTLVQLVCNDHKVRNYFSMIIWVNCREHPSPAMVLVRSLSKKLDLNADITINISIVIHGIAARLRMERFLIVLDGVSSYTRGTNDILNILLLTSRSGSKVIITTMYQQLAARINKYENLPVGFLAMEDLGYMFMENALAGAHPDEYQKLFVIGKRIAETLRECSPLAAKVVSGHLRENLNEKYWYTVLSRCKQFTASNSKFITPFILGCKLLPKHLQRCFGVFGTYPRWTFTREELISYWISNSVISSNGMENSIENVATDCFDDLVRKAFIQPSPIPGLYRVDDILRDIALYIGPMPIPKTRIHLANGIGIGFPTHQRFSFVQLAVSK
uniref:NB-ARC domain-containing protein n=1 Tax=Leersia perrieri TaxID=77586 RepID=A0A0D9XQ73_9ORYZ